MQLYMIPANCSVSSDRLPHKKYSVCNDEIWQVLLADFKDELSAIAFHFVAQHAKQRFD